MLLTLAVIRPVLCLLPLVGVAVLASAFASRLGAETAVWSMSRLDRIGDQVTDIVGAPELRSESDGTSLHFNGRTDGVLLPVNPLADLEKFTIELLLKPDGDGTSEPRVLHLEDATGNRALIEIRLAGGTWALDTHLTCTAKKTKLTLLDLAQRHPANRWTWVALVYDGARMTSYVDGAPQLSGAVDFRSAGTGRVSLGMRQTRVHWFKGSVRELRWHSTALSPEQLQHSPASLPASVAHSLPADAL